MNATTEYSTKRTIGYSALLLLATMIWGAAFVAQSTGGELIGPYSFSSIRFLIAGVLLLIIALIRKKKVKRNFKTLILGGVLAGLFLALATNLQQLGLHFGTTAGKAGFITATYIVLVPVAGLLIFKKKSGWNIWIGIAIALVSLYLLCVNESFTFLLSDLLVLGCAIVFTFQILTIDKFAPLTDPFELSCVQFLTCGIVSAIPMIIFEIAKTPTEWASSFANLDAWIPLLYAALLSSGVAYTLQTVGQRWVKPSLAALLMSFESVFAALSGWIILHESLTTREIIGCALMFVAVVIAQIPFNKIKKNNNIENKEKEENNGTKTNDNNCD